MSISPTAKGGGEFQGHIIEIYREWPFWSLGGCNQEDWAARTEKTKRKGTIEEHPRWKRTQGCELTLFKLSLWPMTGARPLPWCCFWTCSIK